MLSNEIYSEKNIEKLLSYDIIFTDYHIGNATCVVLIKTLKSHHFKGRIFCITGNEDVDLMNSLLKLGIDGVIFKPVPIDTLTNILGYSTDNKTKNI
ncbi:MAG: response regulator [Flavobacterium sp.]